MRALVVLLLLVACSSLTAQTSTETAAVAPDSDGTKLLAAQYVEHSTLDTSDSDPDPVITGQDVLLYRLDPHGAVLLQKHVDGAQRPQWVGRLDGRNVIIYTVDDHSFARAYSDDGASLWQSTLPDGVLAAPINFSSSGRVQLPATPMIEPDGTLRVVRLSGDTVRLTANGVVSTTPAAWPPPGLANGPIVFGGSIVPLSDGGTVVFGRPTSDAVDHDTLIARYDATGALSWTASLAMVGHAVGLRNDGALAMTGFAGDNPFVPTDQRYVVFTATGAQVLDVALPDANQQFTEVMVPSGPDGMILHGSGTSHDPAANHVHTLTLDAGGAVLSDVDAPLPYMIQHGFDADGRMGYTDVLRPDTAIGELDVDGAPID